MKAADDDLPWEMLARYVAGGCDAAEAASLSRRIESEPAVAEALADVLRHAVAIRDDAEAHPDGIPASIQPSQRRSSFLAMTAMAAAVILPVALFWLLPRSGERDILTVIQADGGVRWTGAGGEVREPLTTGMTLPGGSLETVSDDSSLVLAFGDGTTLTLLAGSSAALSDGGQKTVHLRSGSLSADVKAQPTGRPLVVHTPTARLEVLGTRFAVDSDAANTRLAVSEGRVRLTRLVDGRAAEVPADHEVMVSLGRTELPVTPRADATVLWRSDFVDGPGEARGRWLPADGGLPARLATEPVFLPKSSRGPVTIHRVGLEVPWREGANVEIHTGSRVRISGRAEASATIEVMLACMKASGGYAGNWFSQGEIAAGRWQLEFPLAAFRHWKADGKESPSETLDLRQIVLYTIQRDAGLEVERVEVLAD